MQQKINESAKPKPIVTPEVEAFEAAKAEIEKMEAESQEFNNPSEFAKYGKMQRQILKK